MHTLLIDPEDLSSHVGIYADTGSGKTLTIKQYLLEVERRSGAVQRFERRDQL